MAKKPSTKAKQPENEAGVARYVAKTKGILDRRARRIQKAKTDSKKELRKVVSEIEREVLDSAKATRVGQTLVKLPDRVTETVDRFLGTVGLTRKSGQPERRREKKAA